MFEENETDKLLDFLRNHPRNGYVWRGFMDMQALSNKYGMPIKIISINDFNDPNPKVEKMEPDEDFEVKEKIEEMILLNTGKVHFDLIMKKKKKDNTVRSKCDIEEQTIQEHEVQSNISELEGLRHELKKSKEEIKTLKELLNQALPERRTKDTDIPVKSPIRNKI